MEAKLSASAYGSELQGVHGKSQHAGPTPLPATHAEETVKHLLSWMLRSLSLTLSREPPKLSMTSGGSCDTIWYQLTGARLGRPWLL